MSRKPSAKSTARECDARVQQVAKLLSEGWDRAAVLKYASETWGVRAAQTDVYLSRARQLMRESWQMDRQDFLGELMSRYQAVYRRAYEVDQHGAAIAALNAMAKLTRVAE